MPKITLTLKGTKREFEKGITGLEAAKAISNSLAREAIAIKLDGKLADLSEKFESDAEVQILTFKDAEGVEVLRHSTAHVLAYAIQQLYPNAKNTIGPAVEEGFYYDFDELQISSDDFPKIEEKMREIVKQNLIYTKKIISLEEVKKLFPNNPYKLEMASEFKGEGQTLTAYQMGNQFIDLCRGPHVPSTGVIKALKLTKLAGAYWRGDSKNKQLTRIYGISFLSEQQMKEYTTQIEEAEKRDHRKLGQELGLFMFHEWSPGSPFILPKGTIIYNELLKFLREEYTKRGYQEVITPQLFNKKLWELSGHWEHYKENMFLLNVDNEEFSLKPMNCPSHVLIFKSKTRSYRELPLRIADFCCLHRNELKGVLGGMTRVRKFSQDDAHIFCTEEQISGEIQKLLEFIKYIYTEIFGFAYTAKLSTRPEKYMGEIKIWNDAEKALNDALTSTNTQFTINAGEGAFYGPKIDFEIKDLLGRAWQCATIQLDFQMPTRMEAEYEGADGKKHYAIMIHRAILGSLERFIGVITEHFAGKFPLWLSPEQIRILTISEKTEEYANIVAKRLTEKELRATIDNRAETIGKKIREAQLSKVNYMLIIGEKEVANSTVTIRSRNNSIENGVPIDEFINRVTKEKNEKK